MSAKANLDKEKVLSLYASGKSQRQIAEFFSVHTCTVSEFMKRHNIKARKGNNPEAKLDKEQVASLYNSGLSQEKIGKALGVSDSAISKFMKECGIEVRKPQIRNSNFNKLSKELVASMYESGASMVQVGEALGVSDSTICTFMREHNIKARDAGIKRKILDKEKVISLYNSGMSQERVGEALGVSNSVIHCFMIKHNIKTRTTDKREQNRQIKQLQNLKPVKTREIVASVDSVNIEYKSIQFERIRTQISDELNIYIPEKWNREGNWS